MTAGVGGEGKEKPLCSGRKGIMNYRSPNLNFPDMVLAVTAEIGK